MAAPVLLPATLPSAITLPAMLKAVFPALTVILVNGGLNLLAAVLILVVGWTVARWLGRWLRQSLSHSHYIDPTLKPLLANFIRYAILIVTVVAVLGQFGVQTTSLIALIGAAGLAVGLALQGTLSNVASGVMLLFLRPFRVEDKIITGDVTGTVREIGLFRTVINTAEGVYVSVPNATLFSGTVTNLSRERVRRTNFTVQVDHNEDLARVREVLLAAFRADNRVLKTPEPAVEVEKLEGIVNTLSVQLWLNNRDFGAQRSDMRILASRTLQKAKVLPPLPYAAVPPPERGQIHDQDNGASDTPGGGTAPSGTNKSSASANDGSTR